MEVREGVADETVHHRPARRYRCLGQRRGRRERALAPRARGNLVHAAQQSLGRPLAQQHGAVLAQQHEGEAAAGWLLGLGRAARQLLGEAELAALAVLHQRTDHAARGARDADRGAEIHHRLRVVAGTLLRHEPGGADLDVGLGVGQRRLDGVEPRDYPLDVAVDRRGWLVEGDGPNGARRVPADAGKGEQAGLVLGKAPAVRAGDGLRTGMQVAGAGVVAEARPGREHVVERRFGQSFDRRPAFEEAVEILAHRGNGGLLQHDLRQPDTVRRRAFSRGCAPGEGATMSIIPGEQAVGVSHGQFRGRGLPYGAAFERVHARKRLPCDRRSGPEAHLRHRP